MSLVESIIERLAAVARHWRSLIGLLRFPVSHDYPRPDPFPDSLMPEFWSPNKASAYHVTDDERRYIIRLESWGEPRREWEAGVPWLRDVAAPAWIESQRCITAATVSWDAERQRIITEFRCEETETTDDPGTPWIAAEIMAEYWHRHMDFSNVDDMAADEYDNPTTVIVAVHPISESPESTNQ